MWTSVLCFSALLLLAAVVQSCQPLVPPPKIPDVIGISQVPDEIKKVEKDLQQLRTEHDTKLQAVYKAEIELNRWLPSHKAKHKALVKQVQDIKDKYAEWERKLAELNIVQKVHDYSNLSKEEWTAMVEEVDGKLSEVKAELKEANELIAKKQAELDAITSNDNYKNVKQASDEQQRRISLIDLHMEITNELYAITDPAIQAEKMKVLKEIEGIVPDVEDITNDQLEKERQLPGPFVPDVSIIGYNIQFTEQRATDAKNSIHLLEYEKKLLEKKIVS